MIFLLILPNNYNLNVNVYRNFDPNICDYLDLEDTATLTFTTPIEGVISLSTTELQSQNEKPKVFPNPAKDVLNIKTPATLDKIKIFDTAGKMVLSIQKPGDKIDVSKLTNGIYFVEISSNRKKWREKIVIKK